MIYVITHKSINCTLPEKYFYLQVGAAINGGFAEITDDKNENISIKNQNYCELTGIYWLWKNCADAYIGITHYRRFFYSCDSLISYDESIKILQEYDVILPKKYYSKRTNNEHYVSDKVGCGYLKDIEVLRDVLEEKYKDYLPHYNEYMKRKNSYYYNMMICKKELFDQYCSWLFDILFEVEKRIDLSEYDSYKKRIFGFMSERLLNIWIDKNKLKIKELFVFDYNAKFLSRTIRKGKYYFRKLFLR